MSKKLFGKIFVFLLVAGLLFAAAPTMQAQAATLCVNTTGDDSCYTSIQAAIVAATAGDTITVAAGTYVEDVVVNKAITLQGAGSSDTIIVATNGNAAPLTFGTSGATVSGFELTHAYTPEELLAWNFNNNGVTFYQNTTGNTLENCKVTKSRNGIYINNARDNILIGNTIENNRTGINLTNKVNGTQIKNNIIRNNWTIGIVYYQGSVDLPTDFGTVTVDGNTFSNNWYSEILLKNNGTVASTDTGVLNVTNNTFGDTPITYSTSSDPSLNEPGFENLKPVEFGGEATMPTTPLPTLRIYNVPGVTLQKDGKTLVVGAAPNFTTIQAAIDAAAAGDIISVMPGEYNETASNRTIHGFGGVYQFGLFFEYAKPGITLQGVKADGSVITSAADVVASIKTNATNNFGYSGVFVEADDITITGLKFLDNYFAGAVNNNKTIEVIGDNLTFKNNVMSVAGGGSLYLNDWNYDADNKNSKVEAYNISDNLFKFGASVDISSGVGVSGLASGRVIANNTFTADGEDDTRASISFNGTVPTVGWYLYPVGGATITSNTFTGVDMPIRSRGIVEDDFNWASYVTDNNFEIAVIAWDVANNKPRAYDYTSGSYTLNNVILIGTVIQDEIGHALPGDEVRVIKGTFVEDIVVDKDITLVGIPDPFATNPEVVIDGLVSLTADGATISNLKVAPGAVTGQVAAISVTASNTTVSGNLIDGMTGDSTASIKGIFVYGGSTTVLENITINGNTVKNISNPGTLVKGTDGIQIQGNLIGVNVSNNIISAISSQGWAYGIEVTPSGANPTLPPLNVVIRGNTITNVSAVTYPGVALSIDQYNAANTADASQVIAELNRFNAMPVVNKDSAHSLNAEKNWWGTSAGPQASMMLGTMDGSPWCTNEECTLFAETSNVTIAAVDPVVCGNTTTSTIDINVAGIPSSNPLQGYQFRLHFDPALTSIANLGTDIVNGDFVNNGGFLVANYINETTGAISTTPTGILDIGYTQFTPSASFGDGKLASITLTHVGVPGDIDFTLTNVVLSSRDGLVIPSEASATATTLTLSPAVLNTTVDPDAGYCDLASAVLAASAGDTLQLQADIAIPETVIIDKELTLDLNGKVASYTPPTGGGYALVVSGDGALTVNDPLTGGAIRAIGALGRGINVKEGGDLVVNGGAIQGEYASVYVRANSSMILNGGLIGGVNGAIEYSGIIVLGDGTTDSAILEVKGGEIVSYDFAISGNGGLDATTQAPLYSGTKITITAGTITSTGAKGEGIYHPQAGTLNISGGTITGHQGVEMRSGTLNLTGGTIHAIGNYVANADLDLKNGYSTDTGDAIFIGTSGAGYAGNVVVNISGTPIITSDNGFALREEVLDGVTFTNTQLINVTGGTFTGGTGTDEAGAAVKFDTVDPTILKLTGGLYNTDPADNGALVNPVVYVFVPYGTVYNTTASMYEIVGISLNAADFGYVNYNTALGYMRGVTSGFTTTNFSLASATAIEVKLYSGDTLLQTNLFNMAKITELSTVFTSPFDIFGTFNYDADGYWANSHATEYGQHAATAPTKVVATVTLPGGTLEATNTILFPADYSLIDPVLVAEDFAYMARSGVRGVTAGFHPVNFLMDQALTVKIELFSGAGTTEDPYVLLQTNTSPHPADLKDITPAQQYSGPFDIFGSFNYETDYVGTTGRVYWNNLRETEYGQTIIPTRVLSTVTLPGGVTVTAENKNLTEPAPRADILPGVNGLVTLQGILTPKADVKIILTAGSIIRDTLSTVQSSINYGFTGVETLTYTFTTSQARYLNVTADSGKIFLIDRDRTLNPLRLFGGDVDQNNTIQVNDASLVGEAWGSTVDSAANINYDGIVNIQDLALVGGNYLLTSATAYSGWIPFTTP